jgi:hypothetical protein
MSNDFPNDKSQELLCKVWVELADHGKMPQTADLLGFPAGIARGQSVLGLQFSDRVGATEPLRQQVNDRGIDIIDAIPKVSEFGNGISSIHHQTLSFSLGRLGLPEERRREPVTCFFRSVTLRGSPIILAMSSGTKTGRRGQRIGAHILVEAEKLVGSYLVLSSTSRA